MFTEKKLNLDFNRFCEEWNDSQEYNTYIYNYFKEQVTLIPFLSHHFESVSENDLGGWARNGPDAEDKGWTTGPPYVTLQKAAERPVV